MRQPILIDLDACLRRHRKLGGQRLAARADARHHQAVLGRVVQTDATEVHRQVLFERPDDDLKDAADVLTLADGAG